MLENFGSDRDGRVDGVRDDANESFGAVFSDTLDEVADDSSIDVEKIVTGHSGLSMVTLR